MLEHASEKFRLLHADAATDYRMVLDSVTLQVERVWLPPDLVTSIYNQHDKIGYAVNIMFQIFKNIDNNIMFQLYPIRRWLCLGPYTLSTNTTALNLELGKCQLPLALLAFFVPQDNYQGKSSKTPLNYESLAVSQAFVRYGSRMIPSHQPDFNFGGNTLVILCKLL